MLSISVPTRKAAESALISILRNSLDFRSYVGELRSTAGTIGIDISEICHKLTACVEDNKKARGPVSQEEWDEMAEDIVILKRSFEEAERAIQQIYSSLHCQLWDSKV